MADTGMKRRLLNLMSALSLLLCVAVGALWLVDHRGTTSREVLIVSGNTEYGLFLGGDNLYCGAFGLERGTGFDLSFDTDYGATRSLYCLAVLMKQDRIWRHLGGFGAARVEGRPGHSCIAAPRS